MVRTTPTGVCRLSNAVPYGLLQTFSSEGFQTLDLPRALLCLVELEPDSPRRALDHAPARGQLVDDPQTEASVA